MAEEPQPDSVHEGATVDEAPDTESRKAAAALSSLDRHDDDVAPSKSADAEALGKAMKNLDVKDSGTKEAAEPAKKVKVDAQDVVLLVSVNYCLAGEGVANVVWCRYRNWKLVKLKRRSC